MCKSKGNNLLRPACHVQALEPRTLFSAITPTLTGPLARSAIAGQKTNIHEHLTITNTSDATISETVTPTLFLSTSTTIDSSAIALPDGPSKTITLKPGKHA